MQLRQEEIRFLREAQRNGSKNISKTYTNVKQFSLRGVAFSE
jgi:hypothetical protein